MTVAAVSRVAAEAGVENSHGGRPFASRRTLTPLLVAEALLAVIMWPLQRARFGAYDDHVIVAVLDGRRRLPLSEVLPQAGDHLQEAVGRFRPLYWLLQMTECASAGSSATWWYVDRFLLASLTLFAIYRIALRFVSPVLAALVALPALLGAPFETWARLGAAEAYAVPLCLLGLGFVISRLPRGTGVAAFLPGLVLLWLAALAKESFLLVLVTVTLALALRAALGSGRQRWSQRDGWALLAVVALACGDLAGIVVRVHAEGSQYEQVRSGATAAAWGFFAATQVGHDQGLLWALLLLLVLRSLKVRRPRWVPAALVLAAVTFASQVLFYAGAADEGRYLYPLLLVAPMLWIAVLAPWADEARGALPRHLPVTVCAVLVLLLCVGSGALVSHRRSVTVVETTQAFQASLARIEVALQREHVRRVVVQPGDPVMDDEMVVSLARNLSVRTGASVATTPAGRVSSPQYRSLGRSLALQIDGWSQHGDPSVSLSPYRSAGPCLSVVLFDARPVCPHVVRLPD